MKAVKNKIKIVISDLLWCIVRFLGRYFKGDSSGPILLIPPATLNGSFGDELMVASFIANFAKDKGVTIFTKELVKRDDFLKGFPNVYYDGNFKTFNYFYMMNVLKKHSSVFVIGADVMDGSYGGELNTLKFLRIVRLANIMGIPGKYSGFSVSRSILPAVKNAMLSVTKVSTLKARDLDSYERLISFLPKDKVMLTSDMAFSCPDMPITYKGSSYDNYLKWIEVSRANSEKVIGICTNSIQADRIGLDNYIQGIKNILNTFLNQGRYSLLFLYHDTRPLCGVESDVTISKLLFDEYSSRNVSSFFYDGIENGPAVKGYLKYVDFTITGRMHFGISGLYSGKPMFGVCYANKFEGMLKLFEIRPELCLIDYTDMNNVGVISDFINDFESIQGLVDKNINSIKQSSLKNGE